MSSTTIAVDIAKSVFEVAVSDQPGRVTERHRLSRPQFARFIALRPPATMLFEACGMAHFWARQADGHGHRVVLLPPHAVRPYVTRNKTDRADATALLEAARNEAIRPVPMKSVAQQTLTALHRLRTAWLATRTARINTVRGIVREFGCTLPAGSHHVAPGIQALLAADKSPVPDALRPVLLEAVTELRELTTRIRTIEHQIAALGAQMPAVERLRTIPGIGVLTATALVAFVGAIPRFPSGRHFASYLGLTPRESSSGLRRRLGAISKRGDSYLRMLLTHGARSVLCHAKRRADPGHLQRWALLVERHRGHNKATVAVANKLARIAWAVWKWDTDFTDPPPERTPAAA